MTPVEWSEVFRAGCDAIPDPDEPAGNALALALYAMSQKCLEINLRGIEQRSGS